MVCVANLEKQFEIRELNLYVIKASEYILEFSSSLVTDIQAL